MTDIEFVHLNTISKQSFLDLMNDEKVKRYLPLLENTFCEEDYYIFLESKQQLWNEFGFGPWAFKIHGEFAGWGGLQPENRYVDFALVLQPKFWGWGFKIFRMVREYAFHDLLLNEITILLPPDRAKLKFLCRLNFFEDGYVYINEKVFRKFCLKNNVNNFKKA